MDRPNSAYNELTSAFARMAHLGAAEQTLFWEGRTMMPPGGAASRAKVMGALRGVIAETMASPRIADLLDRAENEEAASLGDWEAANLREMRREWKRLTAVPPKLASEIADKTALSQQVWERARRDDDFKSFAGPLKALLTLQFEAANIAADALGLEPYDAMMDEHEPDARMETIDPIFDDLAQHLPQLLQRIMEKQAREPQVLPLPGPFAEDRQRALSEALARLIGFDFAHGRLDTTAHPFASGVPGDIRITTRFLPDDAIAGVMATVHETGHAMYEAGLPADWHFQPVGRARGMGMHESQSLLMEMQAGRSAAFLPVLARHFRQAFGGDGEAWSDDNIRRLYRRVRPSFIRVDADEVTYPLHVILRYRLERRILSGELAIEDIPEAWRAESRKLLGIAPPNDRLGCLQDIHWSMGSFGYFPSYTLGALTAAQFFAAAAKADAQILPALARGDFQPLLGWARAHVHAQASFPASSDEIVKAATGAPLSTAAFKRHLVARYLEE